MLKEHIGPESDFRPIFSSATIVIWRFVNSTAIKISELDLNPFCLFERMKCHSFLVQHCSPRILIHRCSLAHQSAAEFQSFGSDKRVCQILR
jgi:hypothetical protein